jgi:hypothetical protein
MLRGSDLSLSSLPPRSIAAFCRPRRQRGPSNPRPHTPHSTPHRPLNSLFYRFTTTTKSEDGKGGLVQWYNPVWWNPEYLPTERVDLLALRSAFEKVG